MMTHGNVFAGIVLASWPLVALYFYRSKPVGEATLWTIMLGFLLLPAGVAIKLPAVPAFDKNTVPSLCALVGCVALASRKKANSQKVGLVELLAVMAIFGPLITSIQNGDDILVGTNILPGVGLYDGVSAALAQTLFYLSFFVGRHFLREASDPENTLKVLVIGVLLYSFPMLFEVRMSPQLADWIYGFRPSAFNTEMRYGGYRPVVFMKNGLEAAFLVASAFLAALTLSRLKIRVLTAPSSALATYLVMILLFCKSAGAVTYAAATGVLVRWAQPKTQVRVALILVCLGISYPFLQLFDLFPDKLMVEAAAEIDEVRADSLRFRFDQEQRLLTHASERILLGWGRYGRNRVYSEDTGEDTSITDSLWILTLGQFGLIGFLAQFGLLAVPVIRVARAFRFIPSARERTSLTALALIVSLTLIEQLVNDSISSWSLLLAGSVLGRSEALRATAGDRASGSYPRAHQAHLFRRHPH